MDKRVALRRTLLAGAGLLLAGAAAPAVAQDAPAAVQQTPAPAEPQPAQNMPADQPAAPPSSAVETINFAADKLVYDSNSNVVTVTGNVVMRREGYTLRADSVTWDRRSGRVMAAGQVRTISPQGDVAYGDTVQLSEQLKDGVVENLLLVLAGGGRLAARHGERANGIYSLDMAAYTPCAVETPAGCPKRPSWQVRAVRVTYDPVRQRVSYHGARIELFGLPLIPLPGLSHPIGEEGGSGLGVPEVGYSPANGLEYAQPYYFRLARDKNLTVAGHVFTGTWPMAQGTYRQLTSKGAFQITGYATVGSRATDLIAPVSGSTRAFRGYIDANGNFQFSPEWSATFQLRRATDRTFLRRYDISRDDRLRSNVEVQHIDSDSYFSIAGWAVQTLRVGQNQGQVPFALPVIDYRRRVRDPMLGGVLTFQANSLAIARTAGQDTERAFASARYDLRRITAGGQVASFTLFARGDVYHSTGNDLTPTVLYRGMPGWQTRGIAAAAVELNWPLVGQAFGGTQVLTPRVQIVVAPRIANLSVPNEDARAVELEDSNLFALNRFPGYDRFEDSSRITYGLDWMLDRPDMRLTANIGQSYRLTNRASIFPVGTGLADRLSDIVGRVDVRYRELLSLTLRYRLDKDTLAVRRGEVDATIGTRSTYAMIGYTRLNRGISPAIEDLRDSQEVRLAGRVQLARYWSLFGSTIIDLTTPADDPISMADGFQPVRHRVGIQYDDDCISIGVTWKREYIQTGDARRGNSFLLRLAFRNLGL